MRRDRHILAAQIAIISEVVALVSANLPILIVAVLAIHLVRNFTTKGVSKIPGPFLAKISNIWRFVDVARGRAHETHIKLHAQYGQYVRLGPNLVSVQNLEASKKIYGVNKGYRKTEFYAVQQQLSNGRPTQTLLKTLDEDFHAKIKRPISNFYSMSTLTEFECFVDSTIEKLLEKLDEFAEAERECDLATWLQYCKFVDDHEVFSWTLSNVNAGSDTTAISLRAVLYYLLKNPTNLDKVMKEIVSARESGNMLRPVTWKESQELPYLDAAIKEALRLHLAVGLLLERIVAKAGIQQPDGLFLPEGTVVGINPWVMHRHPAFGTNLDAYIPERWLQGKHESLDTDISSSSL
ncbi:pisatin demethylase [Colletotrichum salicis]|uniref:Pisatin demethylase n=1 Tax=Colletotrichum salicis TaxID=1209931 RepID=A0A135S5V7_9PEZI|nr:pisatin demethylase [Colletotrichum salicis]